MGAFVVGDTMALVRLVPIVAVLMALGCGNAFSWNYSGRTLHSMNDPEPWLAGSSGSATIEVTDDFDGSVEKRLVDGWVLLGTATWTGTDPGSDETAREQAAGVGASLVLVARRGAGYRNVPPQPTVERNGLALTYRISKGKASFGSVTMPEPKGKCAEPPPPSPTQVSLWTVRSAFWAQRLHSPVLGAVTYPLPNRSRCPFAPSPGVAVVCVVKGSPAADAGIMPKDVLLELGGTAIRTEDGLTQLLRERRGTEQSLRYRRNGVEATVVVQLGK